MRKRLISFLLCIVMCVALLPVSTQAVETAPAFLLEGDVWDGSITQPTKLIQKDGVNYYEITRCSELAYVAQMGGSWLKANYILGNHLIFNDHTIEWDETGALITSSANLKEWVPIGNKNGSFSGYFCGNSYLISGIYIDSKQQYVGLFSSLDGLGIIDGITLVNSYFSGNRDVGGVVGYNQGGEIRNCRTYSCVYSTSGAAGGLSGGNLCGDIINCVNYGDVFSKGDYVGGIIGDSYMSNILRCANYGKVCADGNYVGGVAGVMSYKFEIEESINYGAVLGNSCVGGICGQAEGGTTPKGYIGDCYNIGPVNGVDSVGGIIGSCSVAELKSCYNLANIGGTSNIGAIVGYTDSVFDRSEEHNNYYLDGYAVSGYGNSIDINNAVEKKSETQLKNRDSYHNWDFDEIWSISANKNGGYPYLKWQESMLGNIAVSDVQISENSLSLAEGDYAYLTATIFPVNASNQVITWSSSDSDIATVSAAGKVTAVSAGTATITATTEDGDYTATCIVTVTGRMSEEYKINGITVRDNAGGALSYIPSGSFLATVSITNLASEGNALVFLASYNAAGQYQGLMWVSVEDLPVGATIKVTLPVENATGEIKNLKAFTVASFSSLTPLGAVVSFLP